MKSSNNCKYILLRHKLLSVLKQHTSELGVKVYQYVLANENKHYLSLSLISGNVSYARKPIYILCEDRRVSVTLGRYIRAYIDDTVPDAILEDYCNSIMMNFIECDESKFELVSGDDIVKAYSSGFAHYSCMSGEENKRLVKLYSINDNVRLLKYTGSQKARALVWHTTCNNYFLDRIYPNNAIAIQLMRNYAKKNNWLYRPHNNIPDHIIDELDLSIKIKGCSTWPYMDTFRYATSIDKEMILQTRPARYLFNCDSGHFEDAEEDDYEDEYYENEDCEDEYYEEDPCDDCGYFCCTCYDECEDEE